MSFTYSSSANNTREKMICAMDRFSGTATRLDAVSYMRGTERFAIRTLLDVRLAKGLASDDTDFSMGIADQFAADMTFRQISVQVAFLRWAINTGMTAGLANKPITMLMEWMTVLVADGFPTTHTEY